jgi:alpha-galactosidase
MAGQQQKKIISAQQQCKLERNQSMMNRGIQTRQITTLAVMVLLAGSLQAAEAPVQLPDPDGKPGDATKPVKVYILAGQSNMVGMGDLSGAKNIYTGVYLSSDPAVPEGPFQIYRVGNYKVSTVTVYLPDGTATDKPVAEGQLEVPQHGVYQLHCGFGESSSGVMKLDGKEVYRREAGGEPVKQDVTLEPGKRYAFTISGFKGDPPRFWLQKTDLLGNGDLEAVARREGKFPWLVDAEGNWTVRNDVYFQEARLAQDGKGSPLSATSNGKSIGPELGFGHVLGTFHDEQVLLIKTAQGNRSLGFDFRPPSSGRTDPDNEFESLEYTLMVEGVRKTLDNIDKVVPGYKGQGYEIAGFAWFQGHKDSGTEQSIAEYEKNLVNLINDVRKEFKVPKLPVVVATVGFGGHNMQDKFLRILKAQMAVGDAKQHPEYAGTVASVDTRGFWREVDESPTSQDYHYNRNAETYMLIGDALGRAMVGLLGGKAEPLPQTPRPKRVAGQKNFEPSEEEKAAAQKALTPIILDGIAASYVADPRYNKSLLQEAAGERPQRANQFLRGAMYGLVNCYRTAGIDGYDWRPFGPDLNKAQWDYFSFDAPETLPAEKGNRYRKVTYPEGMANWIAPDFDAGKAGWKKGLQPFGQLDGKLAPLSETCTAPFCRCSEKPKTLWEKEVLLIRATFEFPPLKEGHRYRIVVGGSAHVNSGEGYAIYVNGKLLAESNAGVAVRQGGQPRGAYIYNDFLDEFRDGKVTIAATSFLRYNHPRIKPYPPRGHITLQIEEQKLPPLPVASGK